MTKLDPDERQQVHNVRILELQSGEISGKEFVESLIIQVGFSRFEAYEQWQAIRDNGMMGIYNAAKSGCKVQFKSMLHGWQVGVIREFYGADRAGVIVELHDGFRAPFALYELRMVK